MTLVSLHERCETVDYFEVRTCQNITYFYLQVFYKMSSKYSSLSVSRHKSDYRREERRSRSRDREYRDEGVSKSSNSCSTSRNRKSRSRSPYESRDTRKQETYESSERSKSSSNKNKMRKKSEDEEKSGKHKKKSKKKRKSSSSSSDSSSSSSSSSGSEEDGSAAERKLLQRLEDERLRQLSERKKLKEQMKAKETPEEKRARRLKEKREKERRRRERMGWDGEYQHYTNQDNPFGDAALTQTFVWSKKLASEGLADASPNQLDARTRQKQLDNKLELEKVKKRRVEREAEREAREEEALALQRGREAAEWRHWRALEDAFHLKQARLRTHIRIQDGRAKAIDLLAWYVSAEGEVDAVEMHEPYTYLNGLHAADLEDLLEDIKVYKELENDANLSYWSDITTIVKDELEKLRRAEGAAGGAAAGEGGASRRDGIHHAVAQDVTQVFKGKTGAQLEALQQQIENKIKGRHDGVDIGYWESLLSQLKAHMARARLRDRHQQNLRRKLQLLKEEQGVAPPAQGRSEDEEEQQDSKAERKEDSKEERKGEGTEDKAHEPQPSTSKEDKDAEESDEEWAGEEDMTSEFLRLYERGRYSPALLQDQDLEPATLLTEPQHDEERIAFLRLKVTSPGVAAVKEPESEMEREARRDMAADEARFSVEAALPDHLYLWSDKYRPRKPRYFNRVHTGFEWNKYNQTHYDMDNPPPKIVQGYKFNIFYPDLIDKNSTPQFSLKPDLENPDFGVLRFHAGPPYEDIAFKIVNREWEYSYKRGFRCQFQNNIFQLWFHFKRYRYRR